jgi:hypothetical protein
MDWRNLTTDAHVKLQRCGPLECSEEITHSRALFPQFPLLTPIIYLLAGDAVSHPKLSEHGLAMFELLSPKSCLGRDVSDG